MRGGELRDGWFGRAKLMKMKPLSRETDFGCTRKKKCTYAILFKERSKRTTMHFYQLLLKCKWKKTQQPTTDP